jgi:hypothetical protein
MSCGDHSAGNGQDAKRERYSHLPRPYPKLPHFGIFHLSVQRATLLIVNELEKSAAYPFHLLRDQKFSDSKRERLTVEIRTKVTAEVQAHLLRAIANGRLESVRLRGNQEVFITDGDEDPTGTRTYLFYGHLIRWLADNGFATRCQVEHLIFEEYEPSEINLTKEVEYLILGRRKLQGYDFTELHSVGNVPLIFTDDDEPDLDRITSPALNEIQDLRRQLRQPDHLRLAIQLPE